MSTHEEPPFPSVPRARPGQPAGWRHTNNPYKSARKHAILNFCSLFATFSLSLLDTDAKFIMVVLRLAVECVIHLDPDPQEAKAKEKPDICDGGGRSTGGFLVVAPGFLKGETQERLLS